MIFFRMIGYPAVYGEELADNVRERNAARDFAVIRCYNNKTVVRKHDAVIGIRLFSSADEAAAVNFNDGFSRFRFV